MIKVMFNPEQFPNVRVGISEDYDTLEGPVEFIKSNENIIEYDTEQELADFYANVDFRLFDDICELLLKKYPDDDDNWRIEDCVEHFFTIRQVSTQSLIKHYLDKEKLIEYLINDYEELDKLTDLYMPNDDYNHYLGQMNYIRTLLDDLKKGLFDEKEN